MPPRGNVWIINCEIEDSFPISYMYANKYYCFTALFIIFVNTTYDCNIIIFVKYLSSFRENTIIITSDIQYLEVFQRCNIYGDKLIQRLNHYY